MPSRGPALTFDPHYVFAAIDAWRNRKLEPVLLSDLERDIGRLLRERFTAWTIMGLHKQVLSTAAVTKAVGVFTTLKLAKKTTRGKGEARVAILTVTAEGREVLTEEPISGTLHLRFAECLSKASPDISRLLDLLAEHGPLTQPILHPVLEAPRRGLAYQAAVKEGLSAYQRQVTTSTLMPHTLYEPTNPKATPAQHMKAAQTWALQTHPAGMLKQLDKVVATCLAFGLLWVDVAQVNEVIGAKSIGLAATRTARGYRPNIISWPSDSSEFISALVDAVSTRANGSGFATIQEVRGALGRSLGLSPVAVDALLRETRDAGDRHEVPLELHFEPDEDQLYAIQRDPLIWREEAFEFITMLHKSHV